MNILFIVLGFHLSGQETTTVVYKGGYPKGEDTVVLNIGQVSQRLWAIPDYHNPDSPRNVEENYYRAITKQRQTVKQDHPWGAAGSLVFTVRNLSSAAWWEVHYIHNGSADLFQVTRTKPFTYSKVNKTVHYINGTAYTRFIFTANIAQTSTFILVANGRDQYLPVVIEFQRKMQYQPSRIVALYIVCGLLTAMLLYAAIALVWLPFAKARAQARNRKTH